MELKAVKTNAHTKEIFDELVCMHIAKTNRLLKKQQKPKWVELNSTEQSRTEMSWAELNWIESSAYKANQTKPNWVGNNVLKTKTEARKSDLHSSYIPSFAHTISPKFARTKLQNLPQVEKKDLILLINISTWEHT